jgi:exosortase D (VPLPA-CTERM-specific)
MTTNGRRTAIQLGLLAVVIGLVYHRILADLVQAWIVDGNYSHGFFIAPIAAYFVWERRADLASAPQRPSAWGLVLVLGSLLVLAAGLLGSEFFLSRLSLIGVLAGCVLHLYGWRHLRIVAFPLAFLILMIPIPAIIFNQIALPLQFLASRVGEIVIDAFGIPVLREGNVLTLANTTLEVAEACSGIRSLVSLIALGLVFAYFADRRLWARTLIVASTVPVAVVANGARVAGTGLLAHWIGPEAAQGFFHEFSGWIVFVVATLLILGLQRLLARLAPDRTPPVAPGTAPAGSLVGPSPVRVAVLGACLLLGIGVGLRAARQEQPPARDAFTGFPMQVGDWRGIADPPLTPDILAVLGLTDYMTRAYVSPSRTAVDLYVGYWQSQRQGEAIHSPLNCLPGAGWEPVSRTMVALADPRQPSGPPIEINRYVIQKGIDRQLVLYWYQSHGRVTASEYWSKLYLMEDAVRLNRTDGAIVRVIAPIAGDSPEAEARAQGVATMFVTALMPRLDGFLPS